MSVRVLTALIGVGMGLPWLGPVPSLAAPADTEQTVIVLAEEGRPADRLARDVAQALDIDVLETLEEVGVVVVAADASKLARLARVAGTRLVVPNMPVTTSLAESVPAIGADVAWGFGHTGTGQRIAVIDTGVDVGHPALAGAVTEEACFAPVGATCPDGGASQLGPGAAAPGPCEQCAHGTHVTGIIASRGGGGVAAGVAPGTEVLALNIFTRPASGAPAADLASLLAGLDHVASRAAEEPIAAVNLSLVLGSGFWSTSCDAEPVLAPLRAAVDELASRGVVTVVAAGNGGSNGQLRAPACLSRTLAVSSSSKGSTPQLSSFADLGPLVDLVAPGESIVSAAPGGVAAMSGTSMATPHVTGSIALLQGWRPDVASARLSQVLVDAGAPIVSSRGSYPGLDLRAVLTRAAGDSILLRRGSRMLVRNVTTSGSPNRTYVYGRADDVVLTGDWDGDGIDTPAVRRGAVYHLTNANTSGVADHRFVYGRAGDIVLVGDWDGDGRDSLAVRRGRTYYLRNDLSSGAAEQVLTYGLASDEVVVGDWDGDGTDTFGVRRGTAFHLRDDLSGGPATTAFIFGRSTDEILIGDWDGDRADSMAARRGVDFYISNRLVSGPADWSFTYGATTDLAFAANGDGL